MKTVALALVLCFSSVAVAQNADPREVARQQFRAGEARFKAGDYRAAMSAFLAADAAAPAASLIFNVAVCHERLGEPAEAVRRYREYLARRKDAPNRLEVETRIAALEKATRPAEVQPPEYPADGDGLSVPGGAVAPLPGPPVRRPYDAPFAHRVPGPADAAGSMPVPAPMAPPPMAQSQPPPMGQAEPPPMAQSQPEEPLPPPVPAPAPTKEKPIYKQWWFWVFVGVGALIIVDVATSSSGDSGDSAKPARGLTLIKF